MNDIDADRIGITHRYYHCSYSFQIRKADELKAKFIFSYSCRFNDTGIVLKGYNNIYSIAFPASTEIALNGSVVHACENFFPLKEVSEDEFNRVYRKALKLSNFK